MRLQGPALLLACVALLAQPAAAAGPTLPPADPEVEANAKAHFEEGTRAFAAGDYQTAVNEFVASFALRPYPDLLMNVAAAYERVYHPDDARAHYERYLAEAPPDAELRPLAEKRLRVLRNLPGSIRVESNKDAAIVLTGPNGLRDDAHTAPYTFGNLPPGVYHVRITFPDHVPVEEDVTLHPGDAMALPRTLGHQVEQFTLFSVPDGARVFIDDKEEGVTPFSRLIETGRDRHLRLEAPDFPAYKEPFSLEAGHPYYKRIKLTRPRSSGRTELVLASMAYGGFVSSALAVAIGGTRVSTGTGLFILVPTAAAGVGAGFLVSWALTDDNTKVGHSSIIIGSTLWGGLLGTELAFGLRLSAGDDQKTTQQNTLALALLGSGLGVGAGIVTAWLNDTSPGDAALVNSGGLWGTIAGALLTESLAFGNEQHDRALGFITLGTTAGGVLTGAVLARFFELSRAHVGIIDAAGLLGLILGYGIGYAAGDDLTDASNGTLCPTASVRRCVSGARYGLGGLAVGLLTAAILTRKYQGDLPTADALITHHGDRWALGLPTLRPGLARTPEGVGHHLLVDLLRGEF